MPLESFGSKNPFLGLPRVDSVEELESFLASDLTRMHVKLDAGETATYARSLEYILSQVYTQKYPSAIAAEVFPVDTSHPAAAESYTYRQIIGVGEMRSLQNWTTDFPAVAFQGSEWTAGYESFGASYGYSLMDLRRAAYAGVALEDTKAKLVRLVAANKFESFAVSGSVGSQVSGGANPIYGVMNTPNVPVLYPFRTSANAAGVAGVALSAATNSGSSFDCKFDDPTVTAEQIVKVFESMATFVSVNTKQAHSVDSVVGPLTTYNLLATRKWNTSIGGRDSILDVVLNGKFVTKYTPWQRAEGLGASSKGRMLFTRKDPETMRLLAPVMFEQFAPQSQGLAWNIPCHTRLGGAFVPYPLAHAYLDGFMT